MIITSEQYWQLLSELEIKGKLPKGYHIVEESLEDTNSSVIALCVENNKALLLIETKRFTQEDNTLSEIINKTFLKEITYISERLANIEFKEEYINGR